MRHLMADPSELGITIPDYTPLPDGAPLRTHWEHAGVLYLSGHLPDRPGWTTWRGIVGADITTDQAVQAASATALNLLATLQHATGDLDRIQRVLKLTGFVRSAPDFADQPTVVNGASEIFLKLWGPERGRHVRSAIGVAALPFGAPVEVELSVVLAP